LHAILIVVKQVTQLSPIFNKGGFFILRVKMFCMRGEKRVGLLGRLLSTAGHLFSFLGPTAWFVFVVGILLFVLLRQFQSFLVERLLFGRRHSPPPSTCNTATTITINK
jgi:hypothetical protein